MNLFIYLVKLIYMIKFLVALAFGILDFCVLDFKSSKRWVCTMQAVLLPSRNVKVTGVGRREGVSPCRAIERCFAESPFSRRRSSVRFT